MRKSILLFVALFTLIACNNETRYTTSSPEIDLAKKSIQAYEAGDWNTWINKFSDDAKIYHNNWDKFKTSDEAVEGHKQMLKNFSSYSYIDDPIFFEMVIDDKGEKWVNYWAVWEGTSVNGTELKIPIHMSSNYKDGKVVAEYGFWDTHSLMIVMDEIAENEAEASNVELIQE